MWMVSTWGRTLPGATLATHTRYFAGARPRERGGGARAGGGEGGGGGEDGGEARGAAVRVALGGAGRGEGGSMARREWHGGEGTAGMTRRE